MRYLMLRPGDEDIEVKTRLDDDDYQEAISGDAIIVRVEDDITIEQLSPATASWDQL